MGRRRPQSATAAARKETDPYLSSLVTSGLQAAGMSSDEMAVRPAGKYQSIKDLAGSDAKAAAATTTAAATGSGDQALESGQDSTSLAKKRKEEVAAVHESFKRKNPNPPKFTPFTGLPIGTVGGTKKISSSVEVEPDRTTGVVKGKKEEPNNNGSCSVLRVRSESQSDRISKLAAAGAGGSRDKSASSTSINANSSASPRRPSSAPSQRPSQRTRFTSSVETFASEQRKHHEDGLDERSAAAVKNPRLANVPFLHTRGVVLAIAPKRNKQQQLLMEKRRDNHKTGSSTPTMAAHHKTKIEKEVERMKSSYNEQFPIYSEKDVNEAVLTKWKTSSREAAAEARSNDHNADGSKKSGGCKPHEVMNRNLVQTVGAPMGKNTSPAAGNKITKDEFYVTSTDVAYRGGYRPKIKDSRQRQSSLSSMSAYYTSMPTPPQVSVPANEVESSPRRIRLPQNGEFVTVIGSNAISGGSRSSSKISNSGAPSSYYSSTSRSPRSLHPAGGAASLYARTGSVDQHNLRSVNLVAGSDAAAQHYRSSSTSMSGGGRDRKATVNPEYDIAGQRRLQHQPQTYYRN